MRERIFTSNFTNYSTSNFRLYYASKSVETCNNTEKDFIMRLEAADLFFLDNYGLQDVLDL